MSVDVAPKKKLKTVQIFGFFYFLTNFQEEVRLWGPAGRCCRGVRTAEHRGIGPDCWPTEVDARPGRLRDCTVHHSRDRRGALALAAGLVTGCRGPC